MKVKRFELDPARPLAHTVHQVYRDELIAGLDVLSRKPQGVEEAVHDFRKSIKKSRSLLRLVRRDLGDQYSFCNRSLRDAARLLSPQRDRDALREGFDTLLDEAESDAERDALCQARAALMPGDEEPSRTGNGLEVLPEVTSLVERSLRAFDSTQIRTFETLSAGLAKSYHGARKKYRKALGRDGEALHALRKKVKDHRYQLRLVRPLHRPVLHAERSVARDVSDLLGDEHDMFELRESLRTTKLPDPERAVVLGAIERRRKHLQERALFVCRLMLAEKTKAHRRRIEEYAKRSATDASWTMAKRGG